MGKYDALMAYGGEDAAAPSKYAALMDYPAPAPAPAPSAPQQATPGTGEAALLGGVHGLTFGTAPAIAALGTKAAGLLPSNALSWLTEKTTGIKAPPAALEALTARPYGEIREQYRGSEQAAQAAHPYAYGAGEIGGSLLAPVPGAGFIKGTSLGAKALRSGVLGAEYGALFGAGEAVGEGAGVKETLERTGRGAITGGVTGAVAAPVIAGISRVARGSGDLVKDITKGATKAPKRLANEVKFRAGEDRSTLTEVLGELPEARRAVTVVASTNPGGAAKTIDGVINKATDGNDAAFAAIQRQHRGVPLQPIADRLVALEGRLNQQGRGVAADAVGRVRTDLLKRYGTSGKVTPDLTLSPDIKLSAQQIRNIRNDMGAIADPARQIPANTRRQALTKIYGILNSEIEDVASRTTGVDVAALRTRNRQIATLIPVRDALAARAESEAEFGTLKKIKALPGKALKRTAREIGELPQDAAALTGAAVATKLAPTDEMIYQRWRMRLPKELQYEGDYDLRGFYKKNPTFTAAPGQHMTDEFKLPNHPTFSDESKYYNEKTKHLGGHWEGDIYVPNDENVKRRKYEFAGQIEPGNVNLANRPRVKNADGSVSTIRSMSFGENGEEILVPTVSEDGRIMSDDEAIAQYHRTGKHLGKFKSVAAADAAAKALHEEQERMGDKWGRPLASNP